MLRVEGTLFFFELNENTSCFEEKNKIAEHKSKGGSVDAAFWLSRNCCMISNKKCLLKNKWVQRLRLWVQVRACLPNPGESLNKKKTRKRFFSLKKKGSNWMVRHFIWLQLMAEISIKMRAGRAVPPLEKVQTGLKTKRRRRNPWMKRHLVGCLLNKAPFCPLKPGPIVTRLWYMEAGDRGGDGGVGGY